MALISPGIEILEKSFTETTAATGATVSATAGLFTWGAVNYPQLISSETVLRSKYGTPNAANIASFYNAKNYLDYSTSMWVVRVGTSECRNAVARKSGGVSDIVVQNPGTGYKAKPKVIISNPENNDGTQAEGDAVLTGAPVTTHQIVNGGSGYSVGDVIILSTPDESVDTYETVLDTATGVSTDILTSTEYHSAKAKVKSVNNTDGSITGLTFIGDGLTFGMGYTDALAITYEIYDSTGAVTSNGVGANIDFSIGSSSIKRIDVTVEGSGYTDTQEILCVIAVDPDLQSSFTGVTASAIIHVETSGNKIYNEQAYQDAWSDGQGSYGEVAAKYPGALGNSLALAMCDSANWETQLNGAFYARSTIEANEDERELAYVRRVISTDDVFDNAPLDNRKVLRTNTGKVLGIVDSPIDSVEYYLVTLKANASYDVQLDQFVRKSTYNIANTIKSVSRTTDGIVTVKSLTDHGLVAGQYVSVTAKTQTSVNVTNVEVISTTNTTFTYQTSNFRPLTPRLDTGTISSKAMGRVDGFFKYYDAKDDIYKLSRNQFYVTLNNGNDIASTLCSTTANSAIVTATTTVGLKVGATVYGNPYIPVSAKIVAISDSTTFIVDTVATETSVPTTTKFLNPNSISYKVNDVLVDANGKAIGKIAQVDRVQTILMSSMSKNDVYGETASTEWLYKSVFATKPTSTAQTIAKGGSNDEIHAVVVDEGGTITGVSGTILERFASLSKASDNSAYYKKAINARSRYLWALDHPYDVETSTNKKEWGTASAGGAFKSLSNALLLKLDGGVDTISATASDYVDAYKLMSDKSVYSIDSFTLGYLGLNATNAVLNNVVIKRKDASATISAPLRIGSSDDIAMEIAAYAKGLTATSFANITSAWKYQYDKYTKGYIWTPCAADVAGTFAYTDEIAAPWKSPAGVARGQFKNVIKLSYNPTEHQRDILYAAGVNPVVTFPGEGTYLYGDKTLLNNNTAFAYIPIRRLFTEIERKIAKASRSKLFEDNNAFTRSQFIATVEPYLRDIKGRGGIQDFLIKCDEENNTADVINNHKFIGDIYIRPQYSINFISLNFIAVKHGIDFSEITL